MMKALIILIVLTPLWIRAQSRSDTIMVNERSIDRPITLHKGQMRIEGGYALSAITRRFDEIGNTIRLRNEGLSFVRHTFLVDVKYGVLENLHIAISTLLKTQTQRNEQILTASGYEVNELFQINKKSGAQDIQISLTGRAPFTSRKLDLIALAGINLPFGSDEDERPQHEVITESGYQAFTYRYFSKWGSGVASANLGGAFKFRGNNFAISAFGYYDYPLSESSNMSWTHQLVDGEFEYEAESYSYQVPGIFKAWIEFERQLSPWFDLLIGIESEQSSGGWQEVSGQKVSNYDASILRFTPGYEILVTPKIWLRQRMYFSLSGQSYEGPFTLSTSLVYNFFPF